MKSIEKTIFIGLVTLILFLLSFILLFNDLINYFIISLTSTVILLVYLCYNVFSKNDEETIYNKKLKNILKSYDSILVYLDDDYKFSDENIMFVKSFDSLLVAQDEMNKPIMYICEDKSSAFLLEDDDNLLVYILKMNDDIVSRYETKILSHIEENNEIEDETILEDLDKTTFIQLKNNKIYRVSPVRKSCE